MRSSILSCLAGLALFVQPLLAGAQAPPTEAPEPKMPPMPSMEGQQGDISKPITQIPSRKKTATAPSGMPRAAAPAKQAAKPRAAKRPAAGKARRPAKGKVRRRH